jgi:hypothetical protein
MTKLILDTNVAAVANGQHDDVTTECMDACKIFLASAPTKFVVLLDDADAIQQEYAHALQQSRPYGLGALFLQYIYRHQYDTSRVQRVALPLSAGGEYVDFPTDPALAAFDLSDRKFVALARRTCTPVTNATDSDWAHARADLYRNGVQVQFLCGSDPDKWFDA